MSDGIYLDNAATTRALPAVVAAVREALEDTYGNPSSLHAAGLRAEEIVAAARRRLASLLGVTERGIIFTSGGTEADNLAVLGSARAYARNGRHIVTSAVEHAAVLAPCQALAQAGWRISYIGVDAAGRVSPADVAAAVTEETVLISIMAVNNEVGTMQPLREIVQAARARKPDLLIHTDAVQALGMTPLEPAAWGVDMVTVSAHKMHGPKGCGALWTREGLRLLPLAFGGGQEGARRPGTENVPGIAGFGAALAAAAAEGAAAGARLAALQRKLAADLVAALPGTLANTPAEGVAPHICSFSFPGLRAEVLLHALAEKGVYVSAGAACAAARKSASHVLQAMGLPAGRIASTLRFSLSRFNTENEIQRAVHLTAAVVAELGGLREGGSAP